MKQFLSFFIILTFFFQFDSFSNSYSPKEKVFYWFYIKLGKSVDKVTKTPILNIKKMGKELESGTFEQFIEKHKIGLKSGLVYIGPFDDKTEAKNAMAYYLNAKMHKFSDTDSIKRNKDDSIYYFYLTRPLPGKWLKPLSFQRIPSRLANGTSNEFKSTLKEGFSFQFLAIGPFGDYAIAEKSKFIFRKNGEPGALDDQDTLKPITIKEMAEKWKSIKVEMTKQTNKKYKDKVVYKLTIKFSKNYFVEDAFQTITIKPKYSDTTIQSHSGITFQGDYVMDNNDIIPFDKLTNYTQVLEYKAYKNIKLLGFNIESFIFNDKEMIEQDSKFIKLK
jgi:hypothetical protein